MKKHIFITGILCSLVVLFAAACKSTPEPEPEPDTSIDQNLSSGDVASEPEISTVPAEPEIPVADYTATNAERFAAAVAARESAQASGAAESFGDAFGAVDAEYAEVQAAYEENPAADLSDRIDDVTAKYKALEKVVAVQKLRERIVSLNFTAAAPDALRQGDEAYAALSELYETGAQGKALLAKVSEAETAYNQVLSAGFKSLSTQERASAVQYKTSAEEVKAQVADKKAYAEAALLFGAADTAFASGDFERAYTDFTKSHVAFREIFERVSAKRGAAQEAMLRAQQKIDTAAVFAAEADELAPIQDTEVQE
ncbi:hypothetical protein [Treponema brennaborense]|uniref:Lipoprotein n=1 Tax=Treponema brennaborense (strain DSM 12168 / CIP 105900 / DD5/3) TaxID=906968 RepID=F4LKI6_TREBD|nr:hypothetical protein [Treponema brennaborense]AEE17542.1 hypothetical protein Trebr_2127 [Treponema brennaborense DSM 12168]